MFDDLQQLDPQHNLGSLSFALQRVMRAFAKPGHKSLHTARFSEKYNLICRRWDIEPIRSDMDELPLSPEWILALEYADSTDAIYQCMPVRRELVLAARCGNELVVNADRSLTYGLTRALTALLAQAGIWQTDYDSEWLWYTDDD